MLATRVTVNAPASPYASLRGYVHGISDVGDDADTARLHSVTLTEHSGGVGKAVAWLELDGAEISAIRRGKDRLEAQADTVLAAGDVVVLRGNAQAVARAEHRLLG